MSEPTGAFSGVYGTVPVGWRLSRLADAVRYQEGPGILAKDFVPDGIPLVRLKGLERSIATLSGCNYLAPSSVEKRWSHFRLNKGDLLLSSSASLGRVAEVGTEVAGAIPYTGIIRFRAADASVSTSFLKYFLQSQAFAEQIRRSASGSVINHFGPIHLREMAILLPPLPEQRAIAHILGTLDDKIDLNRQMSATLEAMARALFESWFVRFDPVRANSEGRDTGLPAEIADLFPDRFEESEIGEVPKGWQLRTVQDVYNVGIGKTPPRKEPQWFSTSPTDVRWLSIRDMGANSVFADETSEYLTQDAIDRFNVRIIPCGTAVVSFKLTVGRVLITDGAMTSNEAIAHLVPRGTSPSGSWTYCFLTTFDYGSLGSTSSIATAVNSDSIRQMRLLTASPELMNGFDSVAVPIFERLRTIQRESRELKMLRDTLLPKLISGDLRVPDAERFLADAGV